MPFTGGVRRVGLWDPSQALRFAPSVPVGSQHSLAAPADTQLMRQPALDMPEPSHARLPGDDSAHVNSGIGARAEDQGSVENTDDLAEDHEPSNMEAPIELRAVTDNNGSYVQEDGTQDDGTEDADENNALGYQIPEEKLRAAMLAPPKTRASYWSAKLYEGPEGESIQTHYCRSLEVAERVAQYFLKEKVVGFDIEWKPWGSPTSIKHNASLIQLACEDRIALFHIALFSGTEVKQLMPPSLKAVLESPDICKVGVAIKGDFKRLEKYLDIQAQGVFELSRLHNLVEWYEVDPSKVSKKLISLAAQVLQHLQLPLYKGEPLEDSPETKSSVRESNWSLPLNLQQIHYAAADAYAGFRLYHVLEWKRTRLRPTPSPIALCDYDNKPMPKPSKPRILRKTVKATTKWEDVGKQDVDPAVDVIRDGQEVEEEVRFETAPNELINSHELGDPTPVVSPRVSADTGDVAVKSQLANNTEPQKEQPSDHYNTDAIQHKQVGRLNLPLLKGADPGYSMLPEGSQEEAERSLSTEQFFFSSDMHVERNDHQSSPQAQLPEAVDESEDEFADAELEQALGRLNLDDAGTLTEETKGSILVSPAVQLPEVVNEVEEALRRLNNAEIRKADTKQSSLEHVSPWATTAHDDLDVRRLQEVKPTDIAKPDAAKVVDLSDFNPTSLEFDQVDETTPPISKPSVDPSWKLSPSPQYTAGTRWAQEYLQSTIPSPTSTAPSRIRPTATHLRAYHLWYHQKLSIDEIAQVLLKPHSTVVSYILQAISLERFEYEKESLRSVIMALPPGMRKGLKGRWKGLAGDVGASD
jgi:hypothetical protein